MRVLITGGSGFIGTNLVEYYLSQGVEVINFDIAPPRNAQHRPWWKKVDILDLELLRAEVTSVAPSHIVNLAAQTGTTDRGKTLEYYVTNTRGLRNLIETAMDVLSVRRLVSASSMIVCKYGYQPTGDTDYCPDTLYGTSKMLGEKALREAGPLPYSWVITRPTGIWGPWFEVPYNGLFSMIQKGLYFHPGDAKVLQTLGFVGNTVQQIDRLVRADDAAVQGKTFYLGDAPPISMREWTDLIQKAFAAPRIRQAPLTMLSLIAGAGDVAKALGWEVPPLSSSRLTNMLTSCVVHLDSFMVENLPFDLEQAVQSTVRYLRARQSDAASA